ncbi:MAG: 50S ribosomal protein L10 [Mycoplasmatota bacterium]
MASKKILNAKQDVINEISEKVKGAATVVFFEYHNLTVTEMTELRRKLRETGSELKVYKNTLTQRALADLNFDLGNDLVGPKAVAFGTDTILPIKTVSEFAKAHPALEMKVGIVDGEITTLDTLEKLASIPSRDTLLTMLASGLMGVVKDLSIGLDLYAKQLEEK